MNPDGAKKVLAPALPPHPVRRFTVEEYHRLIQMGLFDSTERYELIHGWIIPKWPPHPTRANAIRRLDRWFQQRTKGTACVGVRTPITTGDSEPEPDLSVCRGTEDWYFTTHPRAEDTYLVVDVSDSDLSPNRDARLELFARALVPVYWIVNLAERKIEVFTEPRGGRTARYKTRTDFGPRAKVPVTLGEKKLAALPVAVVIP